MEQRHNDYHIGIYAFKGNQEYITKHLTQHVEHFFGNHSSPELESVEHFSGNHFSPKSEMHLAKAV